MKEKLKQILSKSLVVPLKDDQLDKIDKACHDIVEDMDYELADKLICFVVGNREYESLQEEVEDKIKDASPEVGLIPDVIYRACCQYVVWLAVKGNQLGDSMRAGISLMVRNAMLLRKLRGVKLPAPEVIPELYGAWDEYLQREEPDTSLDESMKMATDVLSNMDYFTTTKIDDKRAEIVRKWAYDAVITLLRTRFNDSRDNYIGEETQSERMTMAVRDWIRNLPITTLNTDGLKTIVGLFSQEELNQKYSVKDLLETLNEYDLSIEDGDVMNSSVLISALSNEEMKKELSDVKLSLLEYGIYLYYELIAEKLIEE